MEYSFWKLFKAQYSWKNDKTTFGVTAMLSVFITGITLLQLDTSEVDNLVGMILAVCGVLYIYLLFLYYTLKLIGMTFACSVVVYTSKRGSIKGVSLYNEMLYWRQ